MLDLQAAGNIVVRIDEDMVEKEAYEVGLKLRKLFAEGVNELQPISPAGRGHAGRHRDPGARRGISRQVPR